MSRRNEIDVVFVAGPPGAGKTTVAEGYQATNSRVDQFGAGELVWGIRDGNIESQYTDILQHAASKNMFLPAFVYSSVIRERIERAAEQADTVVVTGFPHDRGDWKEFLVSLPEQDINLIGAVELHVGRETSIARMQQRDIQRGLNPELIMSAKERLGYDARYQSLMGRHAVRLDCYRSIGLSIVPFSAEPPPDEVLSDFSTTVDIFKTREREDGKSIN